MRAKAVVMIAVNDTMVTVEALRKSDGFGIEYESCRIPLYTVGNSVKAKKSRRI
jgi:hypothetical protein